MLTALLTCIVLVSTTRSTACGYDFIGGCSTLIGLKINGTSDSFNLAECPVGIGFHGLQLGSIASLNINHANAITWESCHNNVAGMYLYYRVISAGSTDGPWNSITLYDSYNIIDGPYTTRHFRYNGDVDLTAGLIQNADYQLEIYYSAAVDTLGDDFVPETSLLQDNQGAHFVLSFRFGGSAAPPFTIVATKIVSASCSGDSTGIAGVSVYGAENSLFYSWSNFNVNFPVLYNVPAGMYTVTVTETGGATGSLNVQVPDDAPVLSLQGLAPHFCLGLTSVSFSVAGGTPPYAVQDDEGHTLISPADLPPDGLHIFSVTDAHGCSSEQLFDIQDFVFYAAVQNASGENQADGSVQVDLSGALNGVQYVWQNGNAELKQENLLPGVYCISFTDELGCVMDTCLEVSYATASPSWAVETTWLVYPNPMGSEQVLYIKNVPVVGEVSNSMQLWNILGQKIPCTCDRVEADTYKCMIRESAVPGSVLFYNFRGDGISLSGEILRY